MSRRKKIMVISSKKGGNVKSVAKLKQDRKDVAEAMAKTDAKRDMLANPSALTKANPYAVAGSSSGSVPLGTRLTLGSDSMDSLNCPKQVRLVASYLFELGGSATLAELNAFAEKAEGINFWGRQEGNPYEQTVSKIVAHYFNLMVGDVAWDRKALRGKAEIVRVVR